MDKLLKLEYSYNLVSKVWIRKKKNKSLFQEEERIERIIACNMNFIEL